MRSLFKYLSITCLSLIELICVTRPIYAAGESINSFNSDITINTDSSIIVTETIVYDFEDNQKHGIYRDIPLTSTNGPNLTIDIQNVSDEFGKKYQYTTSKESDNLSVKIGSASKYVSGIKNYIIQYRVLGAMRFFTDHDELYWNVTGDEWLVEINKATASVTLPESTITDETTACYTGAKGSTDKNCTVSRNNEVINYTTSQSLSAGEGLTIVAGFPTGYVDYTSLPKNKTITAKNSSAFFMIAIWAILIGIEAIFVVLKIFRKKQKPKPIIPKELRGKPVVTEYQPPDKLTPIEVGTLLNRKVDITDISSVIIHLAIRGYLKIKYTVREIKLLPDIKDYELIKLKNGEDLTHPADKLLFDFLFSKGEIVKLNELKKRQTTFPKVVEKIKKETSQHLQNTGYFELKPTFSKIIDIFPNKLTATGTTALFKILGFKEYLQLAEKDRLNALNAPELKPEIFDKFLPYAMVLGVEEKWAAKFEGIYNTTPEWYQDSSNAVFTSHILTSNLNQFSKSFNNAFSSSSASGHSSGFSGGSSGGGSGGGGGGSW